VIDKEQKKRGMVRPSRIRHCGVNGGSLPNSNLNMILIVPEIWPKVVLPRYETKNPNPMNTQSVDRDEREETTWFLDVNMR
jgi:hypothetical protein